MTARRRAVGIVRVSRVKQRGKVKGREDSFVSPGEQRERIETTCARDGMELVGITQEMDVSGGTPLDRREGLRSAVELIEAGKADVIVAAYFDRLVRSLKVQGEVVQRVERAGGSVLALDVGQVTEGTAGQWLSGTMLGAVSEYQRRTAKERSGEAQRDAVERGVLPYPKVPAGYRRGDDGRLVRHPGEAPVVAEAFDLRANGASIERVREYLAEHGIRRSYHGIQRLLASPVIVGEIRFGKLINEAAHEPIVDRAVWDKVQRVKVTRGRKPVSARLLARLGVLRCASCNGRMVVGSASRDKYPVYRCPPNGDCEQRVTISAQIVEDAIVDRVRTALADVDGRASAEANVRDAEHELRQAHDSLNAAIQAFAGFEDVSATRERLAELRQAQEDAQKRLDQLGGFGVKVEINADVDWDRLVPDEQRALIRATVERATVAPGRGAGRIAVELFR